ncbi:hypothetical protein BGP76_12745 [Reichenbachiella sp. MSK19-1]|nr:hypothetical protein BGP76_12745 [Reichenbachiella sp. MSK19-1]
MRFMAHNYKQYLIILLVLSLFACDESKQPLPSTTLFEKVSPAVSSVRFENTLTETDTLNYFNYPYIYMGGGVAVADFNRDGFNDIFFTGNMVDNKLYLGKGDFTFEDVTALSQTAGDTRWMQGVTICDVNTDGKVDLYISVSGQTDLCKNILLINMGNNDAGVPLFEDQAEQYGIADTGHSTQAAFFDYDKDGDLDLYVANYPITRFDSPNFYYAQMNRNAKSKDSDHLYRNNGDGSFSDVTKEAGVLNFGLSLSASVADINNDGWQDIYVSNDFASPDFIYMNNGDGTFTDQSKVVTRQTSFYGMGSDIADYNNDGLMDVIQVDMAPEDNRRSKENMSGMNPASFYELVDLGLHHQYMYNSLQLNRGLDANGLPQLSNVAWYARMSSTDWSWAPLFVDLNNDGWKDVFITNGTRRDINNNDFFKKLEKDEVYFPSSSERDKIPVENVKKMPSEAITNYVFQNNGDLTFSKRMKEWGLDDKSFSNGAAYADLDNDGDWDLIVNNIDEPVGIYQNHASESKSYLKVKFQGSAANPLGVGAKAYVWSDGMMQVMEMVLARGFQSSVEPQLLFGLGTAQLVDSLCVEWPDGRMQTLNDIEVNTSIKLVQDEATQPAKQKEGKGETIFEDITMAAQMDFVHQENAFDDFMFQVLLPHKMSNFGPALAVGDMNGDGLDDVYVGGAVGSLGQVMVQSADGTFSPVSFQDERDKNYEDMDAAWLDLDADGDLDLYVVSGGNAYERGSQNYQDRIYLNEAGSLKRAMDSQPELTGSGSCVRAYDYDRDGDLDLFVGGRHSPRSYPEAGQSYVLENKLESGKLLFEDVTERVAPGLSDVGMVTDALWTDIDQDGTQDLILVGEWMPITVFAQRDGVFVNQSADYFEGNTTGWWFSIDQADFDQDGDLDYVLGNLGKNYKYQASPEASFNIYASDFDSNGQKDIVLSYHNFGEEYPVRGRGCSSQQIPSIKKKFKDYQSFSQASVVDVYGAEDLETSLNHSVERFASVYIENQGNGKMKLTALPNEAQLSTVNDLVIRDFDHDDKLDILLVGNLYASEVETPRNDAGLGLLLRGDGKDGFEVVSMSESGVFIPHDSKKAVAIQLGSQSGVVVANNGGRLYLLEEKDKQ